MCQEPTELLSIGCFTRLILILKFRFDTWIPNIQLADMLTKGNFTRDEWNNLLHLFNISHFSSTYCAKNSSLISCTQNDGEKDAGTRGWSQRCGKTEIYSDELVFSCSEKFLIREKSDCMLKSGDTHSFGESWKQGKKKFEIRRNVEFSSEAARCTPWRVDGHSNGETCRNQRGVRGEDLSESETWSFQEEAVLEKPIACQKATGNPMHPVHQTAREV